MKLKIFQVDAFSDVIFGGNPAAVVLLDAWLANETLLAIAGENNLSETAFLVKSTDGSDYELRWFTPADEVDLCGHATMAAAHVLFNHAGFDAEEIRFSTRSGILSVSKSENALLSMNFPAVMPEAVDQIPQALLDGLGAKPVTVLKGYDYVAVYRNEADIASLEPDYALLSKLDGRGVLATAAGNEADFVSRCFFPKLRVYEDPVTGSAHCELAPFWAAELNKTELAAIQVSARRGKLDCRVEGDRVVLKGRAVTYLEGEITI